MEEDEEIEFLDSETDEEEEEYEDTFSNDESARANSDDDGNGGEPAETSLMVEDWEVPGGRRSGRLQKKKRIDTLY